MYGKVFAQMYRGSLYGAGLNVFAVWPWLIANSDSKGYVEVNSRELAQILGCNRETVDEAMDFLQRPDSESRSADEDGRRIVREGQFLYRIVNYPRYRVQRDAEDRREYQRLWVAAKRNASKKTTTPAPDSPQVNPGRQESTPLDRRLASTKSTHAEAEAEEYKNTPTGYSQTAPSPPPPPAPPAPRPAIAGPSPDDLVRIWNENRGVLPAVAKLTEKRRRAARARLADVPDLEVWGGIVRKLASCPFTRGENDRGWVADFDYFLRPETIVKAAEGKYDRRGPAQKPLVGAHYAKPAETPISTPTLRPPAPAPAGGGVVPTIMSDVQPAIDERNFETFLATVRQAGDVNGALVVVAHDRVAASVFVEEAFDSFAVAARERGVEVPIRLFTEAGEEVPLP